MSTIKVKSTYPPAIVNWPNGSRQLVGGTIQQVIADGKSIPPNTPIPAGLDLGWFEHMKAKVRVFKPQTKTVKGSKGNVYTLTRQPSGKWSCSCPGYSYRRFCKHTGAK